MIRNKEAFHGSDLEKIKDVYGISPDLILNFGSNVNPLGLSDSIKNDLPGKIELIASYPDRNYTDLKTAICEYTGCEHKNIIVGNGSTELISQCMKAVNPKKAMIIGPTYSEYEREIILNKGSASYYELLETDCFRLNLEDLFLNLGSDIDLLVLCNPNNPTSTTIYKEDMRIILDVCRKKQIFVLIDETYIEFVEDIEKTTSFGLVKDFDNLMVIRGVSKFFAAPGLRLGYGVCSNPTIKKQIENAKNPWTISALAAFAGELMMRDKAYIENSRAYNKDERDRIKSTLSGWDFLKYYEPTANFVLVKILKEDMNAHHLFEKLISRNMMIRDASSFPFLDKQFFRFCFLTREKNEMLLKNIHEILKETI